MIFSELKKNEYLLRMIADVRAGQRVVSVSGLAGGAKALMLAALQKSTGKTLAVVGLRGSDMENLERDVRFFYSLLNEKENCEDEVFNLPSSESDPYGGMSPHAEILERRALGLWRLAEGGARIVLLTPRSLMRRYAGTEEIERAVVTLKKGDEIPVEYLIEHLSSIGYVRSDPVAGIGEYSTRGGILDFYSPAGKGDSDGPVRLEYFGDEVDSIRLFDPESQRSVGEISEALIVPMRDERAGDNEFREWAKEAKNFWSDDRYDRALRDRLVFAQEGEVFPGWEYLLPLIQPLNSSVFDYLHDSIVVIDEPSEIEKNIRTAYEELQMGFERADSVDEIALSPDKLFLTSNELREKIGGCHRFEFRLLPGVTSQIESDLDAENVGETSSQLFLFPPDTSQVQYELSSRSVLKRHGKIKDFVDDLKNKHVVQPLVGHVDSLLNDVNTTQHASVNAVLHAFLVVSSTGVADRIKKVLGEYDASNLVEIIIGDLSTGFELPPLGLIFYTESDLFDDAVNFDRIEKRQKRSTKRLQAAAFLSDFRDLKVGDFIVHIDHGIGRFEGLVQIDTSGPETAAEVYARMTGAASDDEKKHKREFMLLTYGDGAKLYVPVERLDLVQKFSSAEIHTPSLDRLGGIAWQKTKARAKRAIRDMAEELLKLYAERKLVGGFTFSGDTPWQQEFEDAFPYELTRDQASAIADVKKDMEQAEPMDRLLCGDVGYGKTEVAMRAAFKAVMDGKQVAVLAPTTVLAYQHYQNFKSRFAVFPAKIDLLSRFRSQKEQKEVVDLLEKGSVDVVIGTHRILSRDLKYKDLGLVIVDEEQRFGVAHKERLKQLKKRVDVLTMSATPIPRTLNMSLLGLRDMSIIETPPRDRLSIQTNVVPFNETIIRNAIEQEMQRQGQVFFVHNRVESIGTVAELVRRIVPNARLITAHGQMGEKEMEQAVLDFVDYKYDILVATTIIENGIDIPRANTIIINRADAYGLSQLYQLRGRVGRSNRRAYAYLLIPSEQELTPIARKRLAAIREFSDLGAGFRIAALDLELRGAGNLLGGQQSGHIEAIGFDLYTQMLERTVHELRGEDIEEDINTQLNIGVDTRIPDDYISDMSQRLRTYKRIASARSDNELDSIKAETADRYGRIPESVENLFKYASVRREAEHLGITSIDRIGANISIRFSEKAKIEPEKLLKYLEKNDNASFTNAGVLKLKVEDVELIFDSLNELIENLI